MSDSPFTYVTSILEKNDPMQWGDDEDRGYVPYLTNKALSYHNDTLPFAAEINCFRDVAKDMQYAYLFNSVRKFKRPRTPWHKPQKDENLALISEYYQVNLKKAADILKCTTDEQLNKIHDLLDKGGVKKK